MNESGSRTNLPRSILILAEARYQELARDPNSVDLLEDTESRVIPISGTVDGHSEEVERIRVLLERQDLLVAGALLIRNPYEADRYEFADDALEVFASAKYHELAQVAGILGAREIRFVEVKVERSQSAAGGNLAAKTPFGSANAEFSQDVARKIEGRLEGHLEFGGGEPDDQRAREYVERRHLMNDHQIAALIEMRVGVNPIQRYRMTLNGTRESAMNLKSALKIANAGPIKVTEIGVSFSKSVESISRIEITTDIIF